MAPLASPFLCLCIYGIPFLLLQLIATLIYYPYTVPLPALANWYAFLEQILFGPTVDAPWTHSC